MSLSDRSANIPARVHSDIPPGGRASLGGNTNANGTSRDHAASSSLASPADIFREADRARDTARKSSLALDATLRRAREDWTSKGNQPPDGATSHNAADEISRMKHLDRSSAAKSTLGKRLSSPAYEEVFGRKRRAGEDGPLAGHDPASSGSDLEASRRRSAPTAGMVNGGVSADKPQDGPQVLRAVRSGPNKPLPPGLRGAQIKAPTLHVLEKTASGRLYRTFEDDGGGAKSTMGCLIPDGYKCFDDDANPWICPVRDCRRLFRNVHALGAHFGAGHRLVNLNDNGDGTLSVVGKYKSTTGQITGRVVSRKPLDPSEPPMPIPKPPENQRPLTTTPGRPSPPAAPQRPTTATSGRSTRVIPPRADLLSTGPSTQSSSALSPAFDLGTKPMAYLQSVLPKTFNFFGAFHVTKEGPLLLQLPIKRRATAEWIERITSLKVSAPRCLIALLLFLTGTAAEDPCPTCTTSDTGEECIISGPSFPPFAVDRFAGSCAACLYRCNRWHQKNQCLLHVGGAPTPRARSQSFVDAPMGPAEDESESGDEDEDEMMSVDDQPLANGTSASRTPRDPFPLPTRRGQGAATSGALLNQGNLIPADVLEMEDWEVAPGTIRNTSDEPENIAFSNAYLFSNAAVPVMEGVGFNVITIKPGGSHKFRADQSLRLCSLAAGKLSVKMMVQDGCESGFSIGPNGMFRVLPGTVASVMNRLYLDAVLHVSTVEM